MIHSIYFEVLLIDVVGVVAEDLFYFFYIIMVDPGNRLISALSFLHLERPGNLEQFLLFRLHFFGVHVLELALHLLLFLGIQNDIYMVIGEVLLEFFLELGDVEI